MIAVRATGKLARIDPSPIDDPVQNPNSKGGVPSMLSWIFGNKGRKRKKKRPGLGPKPAYEESKKIAAKGTVQERATLASHEDLEPEILYYFAADKSPKVRQQVAQNTGTPLQADLILARDTDEEVRRELAYKIGQLVPQLTPDENERVTTMALEVLEILAQDALPQVRAIIAQELKRASTVPKKMIKRLAEDIDEIVSVPVLEYSPLLNSRDLLEIIDSGIKSGALEAIARRDTIDVAVADAVVSSDDESAVTELLSNKGAKISEKTYGKIADQAPSKPLWHLPLVSRDNLPIKTMKRIASFVSASLVEALIERNNLNAELIDDVRQVVRKRIERGDVTDAPPEMEAAGDRAQNLHTAGKLTEKVVDDALERLDNAFVRHALVLLTGLEKSVVDKMLNTKNAKGVVTLCWKAELSAETALKIQRKIARIQSQFLIHPSRLDGSFSMSPADLQWYLEFFSE